VSLGAEMPQKRRGRYGLDAAVQAEADQCLAGCAETGDDGKGAFCEVVGDAEAGQRSGPDELVLAGFGSVGSWSSRGVLRRPRARGLGVSSRGSRVWTGNSMPQAGGASAIAGHGHRIELSQNPGGSKNARIHKGRRRGGCWRGRSGHGGVRRPP
jgi:hypothetical protein